MWYHAHMNTIVYIIGPTASGKTKVAADVANNFSGELISADSIQIYKQLDIISGKDVDRNSDFVEIEKFNNCVIGYHKIGGIRAYLLDSVSCTYSFQVSDFYNCAAISIDIVRKRQKLPIIVGGTTLYIKSLLSPIDSISIPPNLILRDEFQEKSLDEVKIILHNKFPLVYSNLNISEKGNKRRLIRKIEIETDRDKKIAPRISKISQTPLVIGLYSEMENLRKRIDSRVYERIQNGAFEEAEILFKSYSSLSPQVKSANGYKQLFSFFKNEYSREEAVQRWKFSEYRHAKNQLTYFKKYTDAEWFDISDKNFDTKIKETLEITI